MERSRYYTVQVVGAPLVILDEIRKLDYNYSPIVTSCRTVYSSVRESIKESKNRCCINTHCIVSSTRRLRMTNDQPVRLVGESRLNEEALSMLSTLILPV
jgi:hypothetical protein